MALLYERAGRLTAENGGFRPGQSYAIHAVDSEGIAAVIGDFTHCGTTVVTSDQWKCAPITAMTAGPDPPPPPLAIPTPRNCSWGPRNVH